SSRVGAAVVIGARAMRRAGRAAGALLPVWLLPFSSGLVVYLNFEYGYSIGHSRVPDPTMHEVRERDYFFMLGFSVWGVLAGCGLAVLAQRTRDAGAGRREKRNQLVALPRTSLAMPGLAAAAVLGLALVPLPLNWSWASRA